jgi:hypothetical protein
MDELWSFVDDKGNEQWVWLAMDVVTREIVGCYIGDRSGTAAQALWDSLPAVYRQCAVIKARFLGVLSRSAAKQAASCRWQGNGFNELHRTLQLHVKTTSVTLSEKNLVVFQEIGKSHQCDLEFHSSLQCLSPYQLILSSLGLPLFPI